MPKSTFKWLVCATMSIFLLTGCGLFSKEKATEQIDPPKKVTYTEGEKKETAKQGDARKQDLYLVDKNGYVVPQTVQLPTPKDNAVIKQVLQYLVKDGPVTNMLPNGFQAVLPANTEMEVDVKDGTAIVDFSKELKSYKKEEERRIVEAVTWTLTQFKEVKNVKFRMNGQDLAKMPVGGTPIGDGLSRANGINFDDEQVADLTNTKPVTLYFLAQSNKQTYYVPVTRRVAEGKENEAATIVKELVKGPSHKSALTYDFNPDIKLISEPKLEKGTVTLNFNENIYANKDKSMISNYVLQSLVLSLTEKQGVENVSIQVNGKANLVTEKGDKLIKPISRPQNVNTGSF